MARVAHRETASAGTKTREESKRPRERQGTAGRGQDQTERDFAGSCGVAVNRPGARQCRDVERADQPGAAASRAQRGNTRLVSAAPANVKNPIGSHRAAFCAPSSRPGLGAGSGRHSLRASAGADRRRRGMVLVHTVRTSIRAGRGAPRRHASPASGANDCSEEG